MRRECLERSGGFDETLDMGIDYDLWLRLSAHYQFDFVPEPTVRYRIWAGQMSKNYRKRYESAIRIMQSFLDNNPRIVNSGVVRSAWAHTYAGRGNITLWQEANRRAAFRDYRARLGRVPWYWPAWRAIVRASSRRVRRERARSARGNGGIVGSVDVPSGPRSEIGRAGMPPTLVFAATSLTTTALAPIAAIVADVYATDDFGSRCDVDVVADDRDSQPWRRD